MGIKLLGVIGSVGTVAAGGGLYLAFKDRRENTSISELFKKEKGWKLMIDDNDAKWNEAWERYRNDHKNTNSNTYKDTDKWGISEWKDKKGGSVAFEGFKRECEKRSKIRVFDSNEQGYLDVKKYCSRPKKVSELLIEDGTRTLLDKSKDSEEWNNAWKEYKKSQIKSRDGSNVTYESKDAWNISTWSSKQSDTTAPNEYKNECENKAGSYIVPERAIEDETFKQVKSWCTK